MTENIGGHFATENEKLPQVEGAGSVAGEVHTKAAMTEFCLFYGDRTAAGEQRNKERDLKYHSIDFRRQL